MALLYKYKDVTYKYIDQMKSYQGCGIAMHAVSEMRASLLFFFWLAGPKKIFWASKKLRVTGPNGIMVAQTFCDIFFMKKRHQISIYKQFSD